MYLPVDSRALDGREVERRTLLEESTLHLESREEITLLRKSRCSVCPASSDILQSSKLKLVGLFCHVSVKRDLLALASSFALSFEKCLSHLPFFKTESEFFKTQSEARSQSK